MELINGHGSITLLNCFFRILLSFCSDFFPPPPPPVPPPVPPALLVLPPLVFIGSSVVQSVGHRQQQQQRGLHEISQSPPTPPTLHFVQDRTHSHSHGERLESNRGTGQEPSRSNSGSSLKQFPLLVELIKSSHVTLYLHTVLR